MVRAGDIGRFGSGSGFPLRYQGQAQGNYPFFKVSDMNRDGNEVFLTESGNYITDHTRRLLGAVAFPPKSIVFAKVGAAVFLDRKRILTQPSCLDNNMAAFVLTDERVDTSFVYFLLLTIRFSAYASTTALPALNGTALSGIRIPLPPLPEQRAIATVLSDMDSEITALEQRLDKTRAIKQGVMQQLLTGAIRLPIPSVEGEADP
jgi:type I restriction enzyme S subunit